MKVLLVCESVSNNNSGGKVVRYITKILKSKFYEVELIVINGIKPSVEDAFLQENAIYFLNYKSKKESALRHFIKPTFVTQYVKIIQHFKPDVIHFASFLNSKTKFLINSATDLGFKVILQPWIYDFFCQQGYAYRNSNSCTLCLQKGYFQSLLYGCGTIKNSLTALGNAQLQKSAINANLFLSSNSFMDDVLVKYGVNKKKIYRFPVPYDIIEYKIEELGEEDYFIFYGQSKDFKGINILINIFKELPSVKLKILSSNIYVPETEITPNIEILNNYSWENGLGTLIKKSKGVILPSIWPTTTEYALYEAMNFKKAIIAFNIGAHKDLLIDQHNALISEINDFENIKKSILNLNDDIKLRRSLGENAFISLHKITSVDVIGQMLKEIYE